MFGKKKDKNSEFSPDIMAFKNALEEVRFTPEVEHDAELINMFDEAIDKAEKEYGDILFREGDKVMHIKNNYQLEWEIKSSKGIVIDEGVGVFNGDTGVITSINSYTETVTVEYDEGRIVNYPFSLLDELELAYAITIHKSQGSEYPAVIIPILSGPKLLMSRNLLYTALTRAKNAVIILGSMGMVYEMIDNEDEQKRYTSLCDRIIESR